MVKGKVIILGITGGIAVYKVADLASKLVSMGADVRVVMTSAATRFLSPITFKALTQNPVITSLFKSREGELTHIELARQADLMVIAPATANTLAKIAHGFAGDVVSAVVLAASCPVIIAPSMHAEMYEKGVVKANLEILRQRGFEIIEPEVGRLASGDIGIGRLPSPERIISVINSVLSKREQLAGLRVLVTAGATQEPIDPVRYISNRSSGKLGFAICRAALKRGASVTLISAPTQLKLPEGLKIIQVKTANDLLQAVRSEFKRCKVLIMTAAVTDFRPAVVSKEKIKKEKVPRDIELVKNPDILRVIAEEKGDRIIIGFAAETENVVENAKSKLEAKKVDLMVANDVSQTGVGFGSEYTKAYLLNKNGSVIELGVIEKSELAEIILDQIAELIKKNF
jgi:phosphopantothenoylcysteine decarboxylase/phosphopantothenate--cysteine ligase